MAIISNGIKAHLNKTIIVLTFHLIKNLIKIFMFYVIIKDDATFPDYINLDLF